MIYINLRSLLERRNMTQTELSKPMGIRPSTICDLCNNNADFIKLDYSNCILKALKCSLNEVLIFEDSRNKYFFSPFF